MLRWTFKNNDDLFNFVNIFSLLNAFIFLEKKYTNRESFVSFVSIPALILSMHKKKWRQCLYLKYTSTSEINYIYTLKAVVLLWTYRRHTLCCPLPFRRKAEGHCFRLSVVRGAWFRIFSRYLVPSTPPGNPFETLQGLLRWSEDLHVVFSESWNYFLSLFSHF